MKNLSVLLLVVLLSSCASNRNVVQSGFLQKRKYKKGYHLSFKKKVKNDRIEHSEGILVEEITKQKALESKTESFVVDKESEIKKEEVTSEPQLISSLETIDYSVLSALEKAALLSDTIKEPSVNVDEDEKVYVKKWDIVTLIGGGVGAVFLALVFGLFGAVDVVPVLLIIGAVFFILGLAAIILGIVLLHRRFIAPKMKVAKAKNLEERKIREAERKVRDAEEASEAKIEKENIVLSDEELKRIEIRSKKWYLARILSSVFTTLTLFFPFFVFPAAVYTIMVMNIERKNEKNWVRISAIFRLIFLALFAFVGFAVFAAFLEYIGVLV